MSMLLLASSASALAPAVPGVGVCHALKSTGFLRSRTITLNARPSLYEQEGSVVMSRRAE